MPLTQQQRDEIAHHTHEATTRRALARRIDVLARAARERHDALDELRWKSYARESRLLAKQADAAVRDIRDRARMFAIQQRQAREAVAR